MSGKPQAAREAGQEDLLEQIISQGLEKIGAPAQAETGRSVPESEDPGPEAPPASKPESGGGSAAPAVQKNRRSAAYLYLLVLFGAALLLLLLAYFIQRRSSETAISDLRDSMNLSRAELLAQIKDMEDQNTALSAEVNRLNIELWRYEKQNQASKDVLNQIIDDTQEKLYSWNSFWMLEQYYQMGNYEACAAVLLMQEMGQYPYRAPDAARQAEIVRAVVDAGILDEEYRSHTGDYEDLLTAYSQP